MKKRKIWMAGALALTLLAGCSDDNDGNDVVQPNGKTQQFTIRVEGVGESYLNEGAETKAPRPVSSVSPTQSIDKLDWVIIRNDGSAEVVYHGSLSGWSDTENQVSQPYTDGAKKGRQATVTLSGNDLLEDGAEYLVYAIGYHAGTYGGYVPFQGIKAGQTLDKTEMATVPEGGNADEIFAGAKILHVENGEIKTAPDSESELTDGTVVLRRQVAGTFGYFTHIPATIEADGTARPVAKMRLVATRRNQSILFAGFRSLEDPENFAQENVINGITPRTDYDARLDGSASNDAFIVYDINLKNWFPDADSDLPLDQNGDGYLDVNDTNWRIDTEAYPDGSIKVANGTVFGDNFWIASAMYEEDIQKGIPTFQMQLLDEADNILKSWDVLLREKVALQKTRTVVTLDDNGEAVITTENNPETEYCYSIVRNHLYSMGTKSHGQSYGEDEPIDLAEADVLVVDVENEWEIGDVVIFN